MLLNIEAPINVRIRIWLLITAARFELKRRQGMEFVLPSVASNWREHGRPEKKNVGSSLKGFQTTFCKGDHESELPINNFMPPEIG